jgi:hypothetical protein
VKAQREGWNRIVRRQVAVTRCLASSRGKQRKLLALQVELCSPRLLASRVEARRRPSGCWPGLWPQGQCRAVYSFEPLSAAQPGKRPAAEIADRLVGRVGLSAEAAEARTLFDCHIWPECTREARLGLP